MMVEEGDSAAPTALTPPPAFLDAAAEAGIQLEPPELKQLGRYLAHLLDANTRFNLTGVTDPQETWTKHILDSLTLMPLLLEAEATSVLDIGSGGGLPGIPLAIVLPDIQFTLLEATGKKAAFLKSVTATLGLSNVGVVNDRAETIGQDRTAHREQYDVVIARAVGRLPVLVELAVPLARVGGLVLAIKGRQAAEEIAEAKQAFHHLHASVIDTMTTSTGTIVAIEKRRKTARIYPRRPGEPKRRPLH